MEALRERRSRSRRLAGSLQHRGRRAVHKYEKDEVEVVAWLNNKLLYILREKEMSINQSKKMCLKMYHIKQNETQHRTDNFSCNRR